MKRRCSPPLVTLLLLAIVFFTFALELAGDGAGLCARYGLVPANPTIVSLFASMVLHDPSDWLHITGNALTLLVAGIAVERLLGHVRLLVVFAAAGAAGAAMHMAANPNSMTPMVGSSACIFGLLASLGMLYPRALGFVGTLAAINVWQTVTGSGGAVATAAHLGGFAAGYVVTRFVFAETLAHVHGWASPRAMRAVVA